MSINFNTEPYYDDFDETKKFYRILFRPGYAVQARELTQMQTILQNQVSRFGNHIFKEGSLVIPGEASVDTKISYIKLEAMYGGVVTNTILSNFLGLTITNSAGIRAQVIHYVVSEGTDEAALFVRYMNSADDTTTKVFSDGDIITDLDNVYSVQAVAVNSTGYGSIASINEGVYFIKNHFVLVEPQTIILDKFSNSPSYRIGLNVTEDIITPEDEESLFDNAQSSFNYAAPGAHRYYIAAILSKLAPDSVEDKNFIELIRTGNGQVKTQVTRTAYSVLEKEFAHRTYDESGNYTVRPFNIDVREHRNNDRGQWVAGKSYRLGDVVTNNGIIYVAKNTAVAVAGSGPTHTSGSAYDGGATSGVNWEWNQLPFYNRGIYTPELGGTESKLAVGLDAGKAYVQGYEIEKISTEYIDVEKARDFVDVTNATLSTTMGNYVLITNVNNLPPIDTFGTINLYSYANATVGVAPSGLIGTARVRGINYHAGSGGGAIGTQTAQYKLFLFDVKLNSGVSFSNRVKSFYFNVSGDANLSFTADIVPVLTTLRGSITSYTSNTYGTQGSGVYLQGTGTSFSTDVEVGDYIQVNGTKTRVVSIDGTFTQTRIVVDTAVNVVGVPYGEVQTTVYEADKTSLVFPIPNYAVKAVDDITYNAVQKFTQLAGVANSGGTGYCTLTLTTSSGTFASAAAAENYVVMNNDVTGGGAIVSPTSIVPSSNSVTITLPNAYAGLSMVVLANVNKTSSVSSTQKTKTLVTASGAGSALFGSTGGNLHLQSVASASVVTLGKADGYRLISVKTAPAKAWGASTVYSDYTLDISDRYIFDDGQRSTHYDLARITLKPSYAPPANPILVEFQYFTHGTGDFFTVSSYPADVDYKAIPQFNGAALRDAIDFRPRIDDNGTTFTPPNSASELMPMRGYDLVFDYSYYLARKTKIAVDFNGQFFAIDGISSLKPGDALDPALGMVLYNLELEPYTFSTTSDSIKVNKIDNKRYTMRDIGKLEKRIDNLEYYTSLSLLEQQTETLKVTDSTGLERFKNGFIVDGFAGHNVGDVYNPDYLCSIDMDNSELRPFYTMGNINMVEKLTNDTARATANYKLYGDVITLPVVANPALVTQSYASRLENINPFAIFTFIGDVQINPSSDDWFETERRPDIIVQVDGTYNTIKSLAEKTGVLGTVFGAWQTTWTGQPVGTGKINTYVSDQRGGYGSNIAPSTLDAMFGVGPDAPGWAHRVVTTETMATKVGITRTNVRTTLASSIDMQVVADRVVSTAAIPYIRSRNILIQTKKLKPTTRFYPFFDGVDIASYCTPASTMIITQPSGFSGEFDSVTNVGGSATSAARFMNGDTQVCLNRGDVITGSTSNATAVVVGSEYNPDTLVRKLYLANIIGTFQANETIVGSLTASTAKVGTVTINTIGGALTTNFAGELYFIYKIPNNDSIRFRTGSRELKLVDVPTANGDFTSRGRASYTAHGILETKQQTVNAVRNAHLVEEQIVENDVIVQTSERLVSDTGWYDPLAQTFLVQSTGGAFLSSVDIFFASKDSKIPVTLEIREVVNGFPGKRILPFSKVTLNPDKVNISTNTVTLNDTLVPSYDTPTKFSFPSPVYVQDNTEYCIVLASDSNGYRAWISQLGDPIPNSSRTISEQPYAGVLFKSQNASTWTADQNQDLKFTIYRCQFDTNAVANLEFVNDVVPLQELGTDPFQTKSGYHLVRVWQQNHGMPSGSFVTISGVTDAVNGIPASELNGTHSISDVDLDSYVIGAAGGTSPLSTNATSTGYSGGSAAKATRNVQYDILQPSVQAQTFSDTPVGFSIKTLSGQSVDSSTQSAYDLDSGYSGILANESNYFVTPRMIASQVNETNKVSGGAKSLSFSVAMQTSNDALSPVIDTHRTSLIAVSNKVNSPTQGNMNVANLDYNTIVSAKTTIAFTGSGQTITTADSTTKDLLKTFSVGKYATISGASNAANNGTFLISAVASDGASITFTGVNGTTGFTSESAGASVTIYQREMFVDDTAPRDGSAYSSYVTKKVTLTNPSKYLRVLFAANIPKEASVSVYYKANPAGSTAVMENINYTLMTSDATIANFDNSTNKFVDVSYSLDNIPAYDALLIKIVMKSTNSSEVPRIRDLRVISCV